MRMTNGVSLLTAAVLLLLTLLTLLGPVVSQHLIHVPEDIESGGEAQTDSAVPGNDPTSDTSTSDTSSDVFVATNEWQVIKEGQSVPSGLHYRMNFKTSVKEAKLLDPESSNEDSTDAQGSRKISIALEEALKNIATSHDEPSGNKEKVAVDSNREFRTIDEIKEAFAKRNVSLTSEMELLTRLHKELSVAEERETLLSILYDLEFYMHQFDNAVYFADLGGLSLLTRIMNSSSDDDVVANAALTIGAACQSNPHAVKAAKAAGVLPVILKRLETDTGSDVINRLLFAISSLIRSNPSSLEEVIALGGTNVFRSIIQNKKSSLKSKVKIFTLMDDLANVDSEKSKANAERHMKQLVGAGKLAEVLCEALGSLLLQPTQIGYVEKLLSFLNVSLKHNLCRRYPVDLIQTLTSLELNYTDKLIDPDTGDLYRSIIDDIKLAKLAISGVEKTYSHHSKPSDEL